MVKHAPGTYVVTIAEDGGQTWLPAPSVVAEIVDGMEEIGPPEKDDHRPDCSLDTNEGCDLWINRLWCAICDHRGVIEADRAFDTFKTQDTNPSTWKASLGFQLWDFVRKANQAGLNDREAAQQWLEKRGARPPLHDREIDAVVKKLGRERKGRGDTKRRRVLDAALMAARRT
jgi:hypothetical protein